MLIENFLTNDLPEGEHIVIEERNGLIEALHRVHVAVVNSNGELLFSSGDPWLTTYSRSCIKPIQALPILYLGAADRYSMTREEIAIICGSHSGERVHTDIVERLMKKADISMKMLKAPGHAPFHKGTAKELKGEFGKVHDNCSGKHVGALALCKHMGWDTDSYLETDHPLNREIMETISELGNISMESIHLGKDGCGIPNYGIPLFNMALLFARLVEPDGCKNSESMSAIRDSFISHPHLIAGTDRFDTNIMKYHPGRIISKAGAAGLSTMAARIDDGWLGISIKVEDGSYRATEPLAIHLLSELGFGPADEIIEKYYPRPIRTRAKKVVGGVNARGTLKNRKE